MSASTNRNASEILKFVEEAFPIVEKYRDLPETPSALVRLKKELGEERGTWVWDQLILRKKAKERFPNANEMVFAREGLEQASHPAVARYHAAHFPNGETVVDCTTGIGSDLIALANRGPVIGFDLNPERVAYAQFNCSQLGLDADIRTGDSMDAAWDAEYVFADPSRRIDGKRIAEIADYEPKVPKIIERCRDAKLLGIKLSPLLKDAELRSVGPRVEFVSYQGECREALVWIGPEVVSGVFAVQIGRDGQVHRLSEDDDLGTTYEAKSFIFDSDPAAIRAHCLGNFGMPMLGDSPGYLTSENDRESPWLRQYEVIVSLRFDESKIKRALRENDLKTPEIKQRGVKMDLIQLQKQLKSDGKIPCALILWAEGKRIRCALTRLPTTNP